MNSNFVIVSYYTANYSPYKEKLEASLIALGLTYKIMSIGNKIWRDATNYKPEFILDCLSSCACPVVWVDIDAQINSYPHLFNTITSDIAYHLRRGRELLSGTLFFNYTDKAIEVLVKWSQATKEKPDKWDQYSLQDVLPTVKDLSATLLPGSYCTIFDLMKQSGEVKETPVIEHYAASRIWNPNHPIYGKGER